MAVVGEKRADGKILDSDCPQCHALINHRDKACPDCGMVFQPTSHEALSGFALQWNRLTGWGKAGAVLGVLFLLGITLNTLGLTSSSHASAKAPDAYEACSMAHQFIKERLKAPSTAKFESCLSASVSQSIDRWTVATYADAQNSFGAMLRGNYVVTLDYVGDHNWKLVSLVQ